MQDDLKRLLVDAQKEVSKSNKAKDRFILILIVCMFLEAVCFFAGFVYYESQFVIVETMSDKGTKNMDINTSGDSANAEYNEVSGNQNQYNDTSTHNDSGGAE